MLCIDNSHFFPSSLVIYANIYIYENKPAIIRRFLHRQQQASYYLINSFTFLCTAP